MLLLSKYHVYISFKWITDDVNFDILKIEHWSSYVIICEYYNCQLYSQIILTIRSTTTCKGIISFSALPHQQRTAGKFCHIYSKYIRLVVLNSSRIQTHLVVFKSVSWYTNPSRGIQIRLMVFKSISWYSNLSHGIQIRLMVFNPSRSIQISLVVFKSVSWYLNPFRGIQTCNVVFKSDSWYSNLSRGIQIRLVPFKFVSRWANSS